MKKFFNNVQMLETSEVCNKFSKSVSYETLVGGTTTTGREYKQTRRLSKGSADKPLSAVGTLTSLLCNSAKVVEKLFHRHSEPKAKNPHHCHSCACAARQAFKESLLRRRALRHTNAASYLISGFFVSFPLNSE